MRRLLHDPRAHPQKCTTMCPRRRLRRSCTTGFTAATTTSNPNCPTSASGSPRPEQWSKEERCSEECCCGCACVSVRDRSSSCWAQGHLPAIAKSAADGPPRGPVCGSQLTDCHVCLCADGCEAGKPFTQPSTWTDILNREQARVLRLMLALRPDGHQFPPGDYCLEKGVKLLTC